MIKTLFKVIVGDLTRIHAHDYECEKLEQDGFAYSSDEAERIAREADSVGDAGDVDQIDTEENQSNLLLQENDHLIKDQESKTETEEAEKVKPNESGNGNKKGAAKDTGAGSRVSA